MRLIELELKNIKSYQHEVIKFSEGINCILGLNGSGKSTIIEAIGSVLFNCNTNTKSDILRYKEPIGSITLIFEGKDERKYKIKKTIRSSNNSFQIFDYENNNLLHENASNVYEFVKKILGIPKEKNLQKLYSEIIAIPQGNFVNAFLDQTSSKKENFDKLFELDIYKSLSDDMKQLTDRIKNHTSDIEKEIAELTGNLSHYDELKNEKQSITKDIENLNKDLSNCIDIYNKKQEEKQNIENIKKQINDEIEIKNQITVNKVLLENSLKDLNTQLEISNNAKKIMEKNEFAYNLYKKTNDDYEKNQKEYDILIQLQNNYNDFNLQLTKLYNEQEKINNEIKKLKSEKGNLLEKNINLELDNKNLESKIIENKTKQKPLKQEISKLENEDKEIIKNIILAKETLNKAYNYLISYNRDLNIDFLIEKIDNVNSSLQTVKKTKENIIELEKEKIKIDKDIEILNNNHIYMKDGMCPILKQKCLNIKDSDLSLEIDKLIEDKQRYLHEINIKINNYNNEIKNEDQLIKDKEFYELSLSTIQGNTKQYEDLINQLKTSFTQLNDINESNDTKMVSELLNYYNQLHNNYQNDKLIQLRQEEMNISNILFSNKGTIAINKNNILINETKISEYSKELINNEQKLLKNTNEITKTKNDLNKIYDEMLLYKDVKTKIEENKKVLENNKKAYESYIENSNLALKVDRIKENVEINNNQLLNINKEIEKIITKIEEKNNLYSEKQYNEIVLDITKLLNEKTTIETSLKFKKERNDVIESQIIKLDELIKNKEVKQIELNRYLKLSEKYKIIREIFNNLPKELRKQIRKHISIYASNLYRKISNENIRIEMLEDYSIILIDCSDESKIKTIHQLSGGEQMSVAISVRLAMLKQTTGVEFYFMDEPTINLDSDRRMMVADVVKDMSNELRQLFVISHDDTFESITDNIIKLAKINNTSIRES